MKVLVSVPQAERLGGVAGYFRVSAPLFAEGVEFVLRGKRAGGAAGPLGTALRLLRDYAAFTRRLLVGRHALVHQNTSFGIGGLLRDAVLVVLTKLLRRRLLLFVHGWDTALERRMTGARLALFRAVYFRADAIAVLGGHFRDRLRAWGYRRPIYMETTVVEDACAVPPGEVRRREPGEPFQVLFMARVAREKGVLTAIEAVRLLAERRRAVRLVVAGDGPALDEARAAAERAGIDARFPGYVLGDDKVRELRRAHAYLLPTTHGEGMPTTLLEALAAGLPAITRPMGGTADVLEDGGMGYLTESTDPAVFAELLDRLIADEPARLAMARRSAEVARERFVASRVVSRLEVIYREMLAA